ncbi:RNA polymerase sigma factor [Patescibacteria group bacterium]|nr:MAG: RNA polymerase sigma factor [Patescibacteria group bacterium]
MNKKKFEKFYSDNIDKIYRFVFFRVGGDKDLAEDLVSEVFMKAYNSFAVYDENISKSAWLITIARNHLANYWRDRKLTSPLPTGEDGEESESVWLDSGIVKFKQEENGRQVYELLEKLNPDEKEVVTFHYLFGYSYSEIAQMRGSSEGAVKVAAHRAIKKMRGRL